MMKRGSKRPSLDSIATDPTLRSKRVMDEPSFGLHRAESSNQPSSEAGHLDVKRAESAHQHVKALNRQFASWVQSQSQNHADELWEDGVRDYLSHASNIMEKFKDVVDFLRANALKSGSASAAESPVEQKKLVAVSDSLRPSLNQEMSNGEKTPSGFASVQSSGSSSMQRSMFSFGQTPTSSSNLQTSTLFNTQSSVAFSTGQTLANSSSVQSSGFSNSQSSGLVFSTGRTSSFQDSSLVGAQNTGYSGLFNNNNNNNQTPASSSSFQSSSFFTSNQTTANPFASSHTFASSNLQSSGLFSSTSSGPASNPVSTFSPNSQRSGLFSPPSSGVPASNPVPTFSGFQSSTPPKVESSGDAGEEDELERPSSPSLKKSEEKGITVVHEVKCKVYVKSDNSEDKGWKDMGTGQLAVKCKEGAEKASKESKPTVVVRNEVGKILLNALIYHGIKMNIQKNSIVTIFHTAGNGNADGADATVVTRTYLLRLKTEEETMKLAALIKQYAPSS